MQLFCELFIAALTQLKSTVQFRADGDVVRLETTVTKCLNSSYSEEAQNCAANKRTWRETLLDWAKSALRAVGLSLSFVERTNSIYWYFNCTSIDAVKRLKNVYDNGELTRCLEDIVTRLSESEDRVHLLVEWTEDNYTSCLDYLRVSPVGGVFAPSLVRKEINNLIFN